MCGWYPRWSAPAAWFTLRVRRRALGSWPARLKRRPFGDYFGHVAACRILEVRATSAIEGARRHQRLHGHLATNSPGFLGRRRHRPRTLVPDLSDQAPAEAL